MCKVPLYPLSSWTNLRGQHNIVSWKQCHAPTITGSFWMLTVGDPGLSSKYSDILSLILHCWQAFPQYCQKLTDVINSDIVAPLNFQYTFNSMEATSVWWIQLLLCELVSLILFICVTKEMNHNGHSEKFNCVEIIILLFDCFMVWWWPGLVFKYFQSWLPNHKSHAYAMHIK